jgi:hypothetical protein
VTFWSDLHPLNVLHGDVYVPSLRKLVLRAKGFGQVILRESKRWVTVVCLVLEKVAEVLEAARVAGPSASAGYASRERDVLVSRRHAARILDLGNP